MPLKSGRFIIGGYGETTITEIDDSQETPATANRALELFGELQGRAQSYKDALAAQVAAKEALQEANTNVWTAHQGYREARTALDEELLGDSEDTPSYVRNDRY